MAELNLIFLLLVGRIFNKSKFSNVMPWLHVRREERKSNVFLM